MPTDDGPVPTSSFRTTIARLRERLRRPLPGPEAQLTMAPASRSTPSLAEVEDKDCRQAGVMALLYPDDGAGTLVLTERASHLPDHPGQISFPGGARETGESLQETALREAREEIGLPPEHVDVLGALTPLFVPPSNFCVYPFVGAAAEEPVLRPTDAEVARILHVPLRQLLDPESRCRERWTLHDRTVKVPFYAVDDHQIWGATAMMLAELLALLREDAPFST